MGFHPLGSACYELKDVKMKQKLYPREIVKVDGVVEIAQGGTGASTAPRAAQNLGMVTRSQIGLPYGPIPVDADTGKIPSSYFSGVSRYRTEVDGDPEVLPNKPQPFNITNFDSRLSYMVNPLNGTVAQVEDIITYTPPSNRRLEVGFFINGEKWPLHFRPNYPWNPNYAKGNIIDRKLFINRNQDDGGMSLSFGADNTSIFIGDPNATADTAVLAGQLEEYRISDTNLNKMSSLLFKAPAFSVGLTLGASDGKYYSNSDVPGWGVNSQNTNVPEGATFFEAVIQGGVKYNTTITPTGSGEGPSGSTANNFMHDHLFVNAAQKLGKYDLFSGLANGVSWPAGIDTGPVTVVINSSLSYYFPIPGRLPQNSPTYPALRLRYDGTDLIAVDLIDAKITMAFKGNRAEWEDTDPLYPSGRGVIVGTWGDERYDIFEMVSPGIDSFASIGDYHLRSEGQKLTNIPVVPSVKKIFTRENVRYGNLRVQPRNNANVQYVTGTGRLRYISKYEFVEIREGIDRRLVYSPSSEGPVGFGCFLATPDSGGFVVVGEKNTDQVYSFSLSGELLRSVSGPRAGSLFGYSGDVSPNGNMVAVSAPKEDKGVVYVYNDWVMTARVESPLDDNYEFGHCVKITRDAQRLFVSAIHKTTGIGRIVIFKLTLGEWVYQDVLDGHDAIGFGKSFALSDDSFICLAGAPGSATKAGEVQVWTEGDLGWDLQVTLDPGEDVKGGGYGEIVLLSPDGANAFVLAPKLKTSSDSFGRLYYFK